MTKKKKSKKNHQTTSQGQIRSHSQELNYYKFTCKSFKVIKTLETGWGETQKIAGRLDISKLKSLIPL